MGATDKSARMATLDRLFRVYEGLEHGSPSLAPSCEWAYRGQPALYDNLLPAFSRMLPDAGSKTAGRLIEERMMRDFREKYEKLYIRLQLPRGAASVDLMPSPERLVQGLDLQCLSLMQHYGIATRLLD